MYGDDNLGVEEVKCRCLCVRVCVLSQVGADRLAGKQAGWSLISPVGADTAAPAGLLQRKHFLYVMLEALHFTSLLLRPSFSFLGVSSLPFPHALCRSFVPLSSTQVHSGKHPGNKRIERKEGKGTRGGRTPRGNSSAGGLGGGE